MIKTPERKIKGSKLVQLFSHSTSGGGYIAQFSRATTKAGEEYVRWVCLVRRRCLVGGPCSDQAAFFSGGLNTSLFGLSNALMHGNDFTLVKCDVVAPDVTLACNHRSQLGSSGPSCSSYWLPYKISSSWAAVHQPCGEHAPSSEGGAGSTRHTCWACRRSGEFRSVGCSVSTWSQYSLQAAQVEGVPAMLLPHVCGPRLTAIHHST